MLASVRIWRLHLRSEGPFTLPAFLGPLLRGVLVKRLFAHLGPDDADRQFRANAPSRPFRFDTPLAEPVALVAGARWSFRFVTFELESAPLLMQCLGEALAEGLGEQRVPQILTRVEPLGHGGDDPPRIAGGEAPDLRARAEELAGADHLVVRFASPTEIKHGTLVRDPTTRDVLFATRHRARALGLDPSGLCPVEEVPVEDGAGEFRMWHHPRESAAQGRAYTLVGTVGGRRTRASAGLLPWLALAETIGVGSDTAQGKGVIRACRG